MKKIHFLLKLIQNLCDLRVKTPAKAVLFVLISIFANQIFAQTTYPFRANVVVKQPALADWSYYVDDIERAFTVNIIFNDLQEPSWDYRLRLSIQNLNTGQKMVSQILPNDLRFVQNITSGQVQTFAGSDLVPYFETMIGDAALRLRPSDGNYEFCVEVLDSEVDEVISNKACAYVFIQSINIPVTITPRLAEEIAFSEFQNVPFQWQVMNGINPILAQKIEYILKIYEINATYTGLPELAIANSQAQLIFTSDPLSKTNYLYGTPNADPPLLDGKKYVWTISAQHSEGKDIFTAGNPKGQSRPAWFMMGKNVEKEEEKEETAEAGKVYFSLKVTDNISGESIQEAQVKISNSTEDFWENKTDENGIAYHDAVNPNYYTLEVKHPDYEDFTKEMGLEDDLRNFAVKLSPKPSTLTGKIIDASNSKTIAGATVELVRIKADYSEQIVASVATDQNGIFLFEKIIGGGNYYLNIQKPLYAPYRLPYFRLNANEAKTLKDTKIGNTIMGIMYGSVKGKITSQNQPITSQKVYVLSPEEHTNYLKTNTLPTTIKFQAQTNSFGEYEILQIPAVLEGEKGYVVLVPEGTVLKENFKDITIYSQDENLTVNLDLQTQTIQVSGIVKNAAGTAVIGANVELFEADNIKVYKTTVTDGTGKYFMDGIALKTTGYGKIVVSGTGFTSKTVSDMLKVLDKKAFEINISVENTNKVSGYVRNQFGKVVAGVTVNIDGKTTTSAADGSFQLTDLFSTQSKTASFTYLGKTTTKSFVLPTSGFYILYLTVQAPIKRFLVNIIDENGAYPQNVTLIASITSASFAGLGVVLKETVIAANKADFVVDLELPSDYANKKIELFAKSATAGSNTLLIPADVNFVNVNSTVTLNLKAFSAKILATVSNSAGTGVANASIAINGTTYTGTTNAQGTYEFLNLPIRSSYEMIVSSSPMYASKTVTVVNSMPASTPLVILEMKASLEANLAAAQVTELLGFGVTIDNMVAVTGSQTVKLSGKIKVPEGQALRPVVPKVGTFYEIPFADIEYDLVKKAPVLASIPLGTSLKVFLDDQLTIQMFNPKLTQDKISGSKASILKIDNTAFVLTNVKLKPEEVVLTNKASTSPSTISVASVSKAYDSDISASAKALEALISGSSGSIATKSYAQETTIGDSSYIKFNNYFFVVSSASFAKNSSNWEMKVKGYFKFTNSLYRDRDVEMIFSNFTPDQSKAEVALAGQVYYDKTKNNTMYILGDLAFEDDLLKGTNPVLAVNTGAIEFPLLGSSEAFNITTEGAMQDFIIELMDGEGSGMTLGKGVDSLTYYQNKQKTNTTKKTTTSPKKKAFFGGEIMLEGINVSSVGTEIKAAMIGYVNFNLFTAPMSMTDFSVTTGGVVAFTVEKISSELYNPATSSTSTKTSSTSFTSASKTTSSKGFMTFEIDKVTASIDLLVPLNTSFSIEGRLAAGIPTFSIEANRLTIGRTKMGGEFGITGGTTGFVMAATLGLDFNFDSQFKLTDVDISASGYLWIGRKNATGTTVASATAAKKSSTEIEVAASFSYFDDENWSVALSMSKNQTSAAGFDITKLGFNLSRAEDIWSIGGELGLSQAPTLALGVGAQVVFGDNVLTIELDGNVSYAGGTTQVELIGHLQIDVYNLLFAGYLAGTVTLSPGQTVTASVMLYIDIPNLKFGIGGSASMPLPLQPLGLDNAADIGIAFKAGTAVQELIDMEAEALATSSTAYQGDCKLLFEIQAGIYISVTVFKEWGFDAKFAGTGVSAVVGYNLEVALGIDLQVDLGNLAPPNPVFMAGAKGRLYAAADLSVFGVEIAGVSAELCAILKGSITPLDLKITMDATAYLLFTGTVNIPLLYSGSIEVKPGIMISYWSKDRDPAFKWEIGTNISDFNADKTTAEAGGVVPPSEYKVVSKTATSLKISWSAVTNAETYKVYYDHDGDGTYSSATIAKDAATEYTISSISSTVSSVNFYIYSFNEDEVQSESSTVWAEEMPRVDAPTLTQIGDATKTSVTLGWDVQADAKGYEIIVYEKELTQTTSYGNYTYTNNFAALKPIALWKGDMANLTTAKGQLLGTTVKELAFTNLKSDKAYEVILCVFDVNPAVATATDKTRVKFSSYRIIPQLYSSADIPSVSTVSIAPTTDLGSVAVSFTLSKALLDKQYIRVDLYNSSNTLLRTQTTSNNSDLRTLSSIGTLTGSLPLEWGTTVYAKAYPCYTQATGGTSDTKYEEKGKTSSSIKLTIPLPTFSYEIVAKTSTEPLPTKIKVKISSPYSKVGALTLKLQSKGGDLKTYPISFANQGVGASLTYVTEQIVELTGFTYGDLYTVYVSSASDMFPVKGDNQIGTFGTPVAIPKFPANVKIAKANANGEPPKVKVTWALNSDRTDDQLPQPIAYKVKAWRSGQTPLEFIITDPAATSFVVEGLEYDQNYYFSVQSGVKDYSVEGGISFGASNVGQTYSEPSSLLTDPIKIETVEIRQVEINSAALKFEIRVNGKSPSYYGSSLNGLVTGVVYLGSTLNPHVAFKNSAGTENYRSYIDFTDYPSNGVYTLKSANSEAASYYTTTPLEPIYAGRPYGLKIKMGNSLGTVTSNKLDFTVPMATPFAPKNVKCPAVNSTSIYLTWEHQRGTMTDFLAKTLSNSSPIPPTWYYTIRLFKFDNAGNKVQVWKYDQADQASKTSTMTTYEPMSHLPSGELVEKRISTAITMGAQYWVEVQACNAVDGCSTPATALIQAMPGNPAVMEGYAYNYNQTDSVNIQSYDYFGNALSASSVYPDYFVDGGNAKIPANLTAGGIHVFFKVLNAQKAKIELASDAGFANIVETQEILLCQSLAADDPGAAFGYARFLGKYLTNYYARISSYSETLGKWSEGKIVPIQVKVELLGSMDGGTTISYTSNNSGYFSKFNLQLIDPKSTVSVNADTYNFSAVPVSQILVNQDFANTKINYTILNPIPDKVYLARISGTLLSKTSASVFKAVSFRTPLPALPQFTTAEVKDKGFKVIPSQAIFEGAKYKLTLTSQNTAKPENYTLYFTDYQELSNLQPNTTYTVSLAYWKDDWTSRTKDDRDLERYLETKTTQSAKTLPSQDKLYTPITSITSLSSQGFTVNWTANANAASYKIRAYSSTENSDNVLWQSVPTSTLSARTYTFSNLTSGQSYKVELQACDATACGTVSYYTSSILPKPTSSVSASNITPSLSFQHIGAEEYSLEVYQAGALIKTIPVVAVQTIRNGAFDYTKVNITGLEPLIDYETILKYRKGTVWAEFGKNSFKTIKLAVPVVNTIVYNTTWGNYDVTMKTTLFSSDYKFYIEARSGSTMSTVEKTLSTSATFFGIKCNSSARLYIVIKRGTLVVSEQAIP